MADADLATRAPENDAAEDVELSKAASATETESKTAKPETGGPSLCEDCVTDRPTPSGQTPRGEVRKLGDVDVYVSKPKHYPHTSARLLLLLTGGTGFLSTNNQIQADQFADEDFVVVMPDLFEGDVAPNSTAVQDEASLNSDTTTASGFLGLFRTKAAETVKSFLIDMWLARHTEAKVLPLLRRVLDASHDEFADAVSFGGGVYAVGYCFGGRYVLLLAGDKAKEGASTEGKTPLAADTAADGSAAAGTSPEDLEAGTAAKKGPLIKAGAVAHATLVSPDDFQGLQAPLSLVCVESDPMFPDEVRTAGEDYLSKNNIEHEVQVYPAVPHGFAVVGDYADANIKQAQTTAFEQMLKWLKAH